LIGFHPEPAWLMSDPTPKANVNDVFRRLNLNEIAEVAPSPEAAPAAAF